MPEPVRELEDMSTPDGQLRERAADCEIGDWTVENPANHTSSGWIWKQIMIRSPEMDSEMVAIYEGNRPLEAPPEELVPAWKRTQ